MTSDEGASVTVADELLDGLLAFDRSRLDASIASQEGEKDHERSPEGRLALGLGRAWSDLLHGRLADLDARGKTLFTEAAAQKAVPRVIEATALRALAALSLGDTEAALALARRGSLMARTEAVAESEILANLVLARVRRHAGKSHLAVRILSALAASTRGRWVPWLTWELMLAGGQRMTDKALRAAGIAYPDGLTPADAAARALRRLVSTAGAGNLADFDSAASDLSGALAGWPDLQREGALAAAAMNPHAETDATLLPWRTGASLVLPAGVHGLGLPVGEVENHDLVLAFVWGRPGEKGIRVLRVGLGFLAGGADALRANAARRGGGRTETGLAVLALAGPEGMRADEFFRAVYGFGFSSLMHTGVLEVLLHRMRRRVGACGEITKTGDDVGLRLAEPMIFPDPRCSQPTTGRVLEVLAGRGVVDASDAAKTLGIPLRTVQAAFQQLVSDGACRMERVGKLVTYRLDDTTFSEPTSSGAPSTPRRT